MAATYQLSSNAIRYSNTSISTSISLSGGSNRLYVAVVNVYGINSANPTVTGVTRAASSTFTEATLLRQSFQDSGSDYDYRNTYVYYLTDSGLTSGSQSVTATFDGTFDVAYIAVFQFSTAYQGAPLDYKYAAGSGVAGSTGAGVTVLDTQTDSLIFGVVGTFKNDSGGNGFSYTDKTNYTTRASSGDFNSDHWNRHEAFSDVPAAGSNTSSITWEEISTSSDIDADYVMIALEVQDEDWTPPEPGVNPDNFCDYVSRGQVRKMISTVTGLNHLEGETIKVQMDGDVPRNSSGKEQTNAFTVSGGSITLPKKAAVIHAGLGYDGTIKMLKPNNGSQLGTAQTKMRRIYASALRLYRTLGLSVGIDDSHLDELFQTTQTVPFSGDYDKLPNTSWRKDTEFVIKQTKPAPAYVLAAILRSETEEKL